MKIARFFVGLLILAGVVQAQNWSPVTPEELSLNAPLVERDADAEALFWNVHINTDNADEGGFVRDHYIRIKIFTKRGCELYSKVKIVYRKYSTYQFDLRQVAARTIKPDGTIINVRDEEIVETTQSKTKRVKVKAKTFALPGLEPGVIIEYRWREVAPNVYFRLFELEFQRELPIQKVTYQIKPNSRRVSPEYHSLRYESFQMPPGFKFEPDKRQSNTYIATLSNVPAYREEPYMPPESSVRARVVVFYSKQAESDPPAYWREVARGLHETSKDLSNVGAETRKAAEEIIGTTSDPNEKLRLLYDYCQTKIKNIFDDASSLTPEEREKFRKNKTSADTLKQGAGTGFDIDLLFAALAKSAGFDARLARLSSRSEIFFDFNFTEDEYLRSYNIAVKVGEQWRFFDPAGRYLQFGMLRWQEEGVPALLADKNEALWVTTPLTGPDRSKVARFANLVLAEDGSLSGTVRLMYTGHWAASRKEEFDEESPSEREEDLREEITAGLRQAEVADVKIENLTEGSKPLIYTFSLRVPGYAQRTGKRLFIQPAFFQRNRAYRFSGGTRQHPVYFSYPWAEDDQISIKLPPGYELESPETPIPLSAGALSLYQMKLSRLQDNSAIIFRRSFYFGAGVKGYLLFPVSAYGDLKKYFEGVNKRDELTLALRQSVALPAQP
jgi:hypothetical protein